MRPVLEGLGWLCFASPLQQALQGPPALHEAKPRAGPPPEQMRAPRHTRAVFGGTALPSWQAAAHMARQTGAGCTQHPSCLPQLGRNLLHPSAWTWALPCHLSQPEPQVLFWKPAAVRGAKELHSRGAPSPSLGSLAPAGYKLLSSLRAGACKALRGGGWGWYQRGPRALLQESSTRLVAANGRRGLACVGTRLLCRTTVPSVCQLGSGRTPSWLKGSALMV